MANKKPQSGIASVPLYKVVFFRFHILITVALVITVAVVGFVSFVEPKYKEINDQGTTNLEVLDSELIAREEYLKQLQTFAANYRSVTQQDIQKIEKLLPREEDIAGLFVQLENIALQNRLLINSISINTVPDSPNAPFEPKGVKRLSITLEILGDPNVNRYAEIKRFLEALELNERLFDVSAVYFVPGSPDYSLTITTYYFPAS